MLRRTLNLGILAHVDAGKTTLTERLLYAAGVIDKIGSVDHGTTQTDSLALERQRGITIKSAVVSFAIDDVTVNLIDTPGHPDFIAEVERVLSVLDGAVLVVSAVEGVQAQTRVLMRALQRLRVPTLLFVNKIDRGGAGYERVLNGISTRLTPAIIPMGVTRDLGSREAAFLRYADGDPDLSVTLVEMLAENDDGLLAAYLDEKTGVSFPRLRVELGVQIAQALVHPVFFGSAITGAGVDSVRAGIAELLPTPAGSPEGPLSGTVFKVDRGEAGEKIAYVRLFAGLVRTRDRVRLGPEREGKITRIAVFEQGAVVPSASVAAGQVAKLWGLSDVQIGDALGLPPAGSSGHHFAPPTLETAVVSCDPAQKGALHAALTQLAEQDPLINLRQDDERQELYLSLYGEVQKEVIAATLATESGLEVEFAETTTICIERPTGSGDALEELGKGNPFLATVGLRVDPAPVGSGVELRLEMELVSIPLHVYKAVERFRDAMEEYIIVTLLHGLHGWEVTDCVVTMTRSGYAAPSTGARDFRLLTPLVLMSALAQARTAVCEPIYRFQLDGPSDTLGAVLGALSRFEAMPDSPALGAGSFTLEGNVPAARVHALHQQIPALTRGEGTLEWELDCYRPVAGTPPTRRRTTPNPLNRAEYLLHLARRASS